jgi:FtsP/CotA-like multicopper oxidase with cupredoxin domain
MRVLLRYRGDRRARRAFEERQDLVKAGLSRRDLVKMGLLTGGGVGGGLLIAEKGMAARGPSSDGLGALPPFAPFKDPLPILDVLPEVDRSQLTPPPSETPQPGEGRSEPHQSAQTFPPQAFFVTRMRANTAAAIHSDLPLQTLWGFNKGGNDPATSPGPVLRLQYGRPTIVRRYNELPPPEQNGGFGVPEVSTHFHNFHSGPDSDGGPCDPGQDRFFARGQFYDYFYNMQYAGWGSTHADVVTDGVRGDPREALGFLWYHDHRVDHTAENTYKGLVGPSVLFNNVDTGDESTGLRLPSFPEFDIPLVLADRRLDPATGQLAFDTFNTDGLLGNLFLVNGKVQPHFEVKRRRYRLRILVAGPARFFDVFLTNPDNPSQRIPFWVLSNDGNLLPKPIQVTHHGLSVAERVDILVDFSKINASRLRLENRLEQTDGRGPTDKILPA